MVFSGIREALRGDQGGRVVEDVRPTACLPQRAVVILGAVKHSIDNVCQHR